MKSLKVLSLTLATIVVLLAAVIGFAGFTRPGANLALSIALPLISNDNRIIAVEDAGPLLNGNLEVGRISIADADGQWLEIKGLAARWTPSALLTGTLKITALGAGDINIERMPAKGNSDSGSSGLPFAIDASGISLASISLGADFTGKEEKLALTGSALANREKAYSDLELTDLNRGNASVGARVNFDIPSNLLDVDIAVNEAHGGFISSLLQLPGDPALAINVEGKGPLNNWKGQANGMLEGIPVVQFSLAYTRPQSGTHGIKLDGGGALDALLPPAFGPLFSGNTSINIEAELDPEGAVSVNKGEIETGTITASVSGTYSPAGENDLKATVLAKNGAADFNFLTETSGWRALVKSAALSVSGPATAAQVSLEANIEELSLQPGKFSGIRLSAQSTGFDLKNRSGKIDATVSADASRFDNQNLARLVQAPLEIRLPLNVGGNKVTINTASLQGASLGGTVSGQYDLASNAAEASFKLFAAPSVLPESLATNLTRTVGIEGKLAYDDGALTLPAIVINSELLEAEGSAKLSAETISADISGKIPDLARWRSDLAGEAEIAARLTGTPEEPQASAEISVASGTVAGLELASLSTRFSGSLKPGGAAASLEGSGTLNGQTIELGANLLSDGGLYSIPDIRAEIGSNIVSGNVSLDEQLNPKGAFEFDLADLSLIGAIAGQQAAGNLKGTASLDRKGDQIALTVNAEGDNLSTGSINAVAPNIHLSTEGPLLSGVVEMASITVGDNNVATPKLTFDREGDNTRFHLTGDYDNAPAVARGAISTAAGFAVQLDQLELAPLGIPVKLKKPTAIIVQDGTARIAGAALSVGDGTATISGTAGDALDITVDLAAIPASLANTFSKGLGANGSISGKVVVGGKTADPIISYDLKLAGAVVAQTRALGVPALDIGANGKFASGKLSISLGLTGPSGLSIAGGGDLTLSSRALSMRFRGPVPASLINGMTAGQGIALSGTAQADISIGGSTAAPKIAGKIALDGIGADLVRQNLSITGLSGTITLNGDSAELSGVKGNFRNGGTFTTSGRIGLGSGLPSDLAMEMSNVSYTDGNLVSARFSGDVKISGPLAQAPRIEGTINLAETNITVPENLPSSIAAINLTHKNAPADVKAQYAELGQGSTGKGTDFAATLALKINAPSRVFVRGRGMDAELGGTVQISGTSAAPIVSGGFQMIRGRLDILGKRLDFTSGTIGFGGSLIPDLDLVATSTAGSTTITITVSGPADNPSFAFSSSPYLPQDEVLAQLIFQKSSGSLSPFQIAQLADAVGQLTGAQGSSIFTQLRKASGFDDLDVTSDSQGNAEVTAGKYLNSKTYLELQQNTGDGTGKAIINLDVGKGLKLRGEANSDGGGAAGIFYEKEY